MKKAAMLFTAVLAVFSVCACGATEYPEAAVAKADGTAETVTAEDLCSLSADNQKMYVEEYRDRDVKVTGHLTSVQENESGAEFILEGEHNDFNIRVSEKVLEDQNIDVKALVPGMEVHAEGRLGEADYDVVVRNTTDISFKGHE